MINFYEQTSANEPKSAQTILLAEDDPFIARMYETKLSAAGYKVVVKNNGLNAYEAIKEMQPDLLIIDINMPEVTGLELIKNLNNIGFDFKAHPVIILTNSSNPRDIEVAKTLNADYLVKAEMTPQEVLEKIQDKIGKP